MSAQPNTLQKSKDKASKVPLKVVSDQTASASSSHADLEKIAPELSGMLRVLTCGSVDDGKSTLIGRLLWDATDLYDDQRETLKRGKTV
ncbi:MAG: sulfate adenylyltransferase, partial [Rhizobiales bacterium]|nr:sulfate adenylyltransferase [Hyphomicrobiales bacterium]